MRLKKISVEFESDEVQQILAIALDDNTEEALSFIQGNLAKKVQKALQRH